MYCTETEPPATNEMAMINQCVKSMTKFVAQHSGRLCFLKAKEN